jgi:hypothetical protein
MAPRSSHLPGPGPQRKDGTVDTISIRATTPEVTPSGAARAERALVLYEERGDLRHGRKLGEPCKHLLAVGIMHSRVRRMRPEVRPWRARRRGRVVSRQRVARLIVWLALGFAGGVAVAWAVSALL